MKIALYIEDGLEQIVLTPESETEKGILGKLHDGSRELNVLRGAFYECRGGWVRHGLNDDSTMIVLRAAQAGEAGTAATTKIGAVHEHAVGEADAPKGEGHA